MLLTCKNLRYLLQAYCCRIIDPGNDKTNSFHILATFPSNRAALTWPPQGHCLIGTEECAKF